MNKVRTEDVAANAVDNLMSLADTVMSERRFALWNYAEPDESQRLLDLHDRLVTMAREMNEFFEEETVATPRVVSNEEIFESSVAEEILNLMVDMGWDAGDLADASQVRKETIERILTGETTRPQGRTLRKIEAALGVDEGSLDV